MYNNDTYHPNNGYDTMDTQCVNHIVLTGGECGMRMLYSIHTLCIYLHTCYASTTCILTLGLWLKERIRTESILTVI